MISMTKLLTDAANYGDNLRYTSHARHHKHGAGQGMGPVVVWNTTRSCNLKCVHCYANATTNSDPQELSTEEAEHFIDDLADFQVPVLLFSGGEPLVRKDILHLIRYAGKKGIRPVISTNGTLIDEKMARELKDAGVKYVGISLDGLQERNDEFRGQKGAFERTLNGIRNCLHIDQRVGLRFTISKHTYPDLPAIFDIIEQERIPRVCFYHLVYSGRGSELMDADVTRDESRKALDLIIAKTLEFEEKGLEVEILTVDNHADGVYLYQWLQKHNPERAEAVLQLLKNNGGNRTGIAFGNVDWQGNVHPDQFTQEITFGNIRERKFGEIWRDTTQPVLNGFKDRKPLLKGRCAQCQWLELCNGNFRARALAVSGDIWDSDPACYLTDAEIGLQQVCESNCYREKEGAR